MNVVPAAVEAGSVEGAQSPEEMETGMPEAHQMSGKRKDCD